MKPLRLIALLTVSILAARGEASEAIWNFIKPITFKADLHIGDGNTSVGMGFFEWYSFEDESPDGKYHIISTGFDIEQFNDGITKTTTVTPNGIVTLTSAGWVAVVNYGTIINKAFFDAVSGDMLLNTGCDWQSEAPIPTAKFSHNDKEDPNSIGTIYLACEDRVYTDDSPNGYAWVELNYGFGEVTIRDSGLVYGSDSSIVAGRHEYTYVGQTPEPTGGLLLLVGSAFILIRRRS